MLDRTQNLTWPRYSYINVYTKFHFSRCNLCEETEWKLMMDQPIDWQLQSNMPFLLEGGHILPINLQQTVIMVVFLLFWIQQNRLTDIRKHYKLTKKLRPTCFFCSRFLTISLMLCSSLPSIPSNCVMADWSWGGVRDGWPCVVLDPE